MERRPLKTLKANPNNPRVIRDEKFKKLVKSIKEFPEMLEARPVVVNPDMVVLGGNMRLKALREAGVEEAPVYIASWDEVKQRQFIIKDNVGFGEWDWDALANEWNEKELEEWGLDVWQPEENELDETYTTKIDSPIYEPRNQKPSEESLCDLKKYDQLVRAIEKADISQSEKTFLKIAATRHIEFNYKKIADFYAHADRNVQKFMESSALVIIDYDQAIEEGFVKLFRELQAFSESDG